jgi:tetratricopeptide (TPR) repeat protein
MAKAAAQKALQRDPELAEAITSLGKVLCWHEWDFSGAERQLEHAVALSPNYAEAHYVLGTALPLVGRLPDAIDELRKAIVLDPLSAEMSSWVARFLLYSKDYEGAITQGQKTLELDEQSIRSTLYIGSAHLALGDAKTALSGTGGARAWSDPSAHTTRISHGPWRRWASVTKQTRSCVDWKTSLGSTT